MMDSGLFSVCGTRATQHALRVCLSASVSPPLSFRICGFGNLARITLRAQSFSELPQKELQVLFGRQWSHEADSKNLARERAEPARDFNARTLQEPLAHFTFVDPLGHQHRVQQIGRAHV